MAENREEIIAKYTEYPTKQLIMLQKNHRLSQEKRDIMAEILDERGVEVEAATTAKKPAPVKQEAPEKKEAPAKKLPKKKLEPELDADGEMFAKPKPKKKVAKPKVKRTNENDPWLFKENQEVVIPLGFNRRDGNAGKLVKGVIVATMIWQDFKEYLVDTEGFGRQKKRQSTIAKYNGEDVEIPADAVYATAPPKKAKAAKPKPSSKKKVDKADEEE